MYQLDALKTSTQPLILSFLSSFELLAETHRSKQRCDILLTNFQLEMLFCIFIVAFQKIKTVEM